MMNPRENNSIVAVLTKLSRLPEGGELGITVLDLRFTPLSSVRDFFTTLQSICITKKITSMALQRVTFDYLCANELGEFIASNTTLRELTFDDSLTDESYAPILKGLERNGQFVKLNFFFNRVGDEFLNYLAGVVKHNTFLMDLKVECSGGREFGKQFEDLMTNNDILKLATHSYSTTDLIRTLVEWNIKNRSHIFKLKNDFATFMDTLKDYFVGSKTTQLDLLESIQNNTTAAREFFQHLSSQVKGLDKPDKVILEKIKRNINNILKTIHSILIVVNVYPKIFSNVYTINKINKQQIMALSLLLKEIDESKIVEDAYDFLVAEAEATHKRMCDSSLKGSLEYRRRFRILRSLIPNSSKYFGDAQYDLATNSYRDDQVPCLSFLNSSQHILLGCQANHQMCQYLFARYTNTLLNRKSMVDSFNPIIANARFTSDAGQMLMLECKLLFTIFRAKISSNLVSKFFQAVPTIDQYILSPTNQNCLPLTIRMMVEWLTTTLNQKDFDDHSFPFLFRLQLVIKKMAFDFSSEANLLVILEAINNALALYLSHASQNPGPIYIQLLLAKITNYANKKSMMPALESKLSEMITPDLLTLNAYEKESAKKLIIKGREVHQFLKDNLHPIPFYKSMIDQLNNSINNNKLALPTASMFSEYLNDLEGNSETFKDKQQTSLPAQIR